MLLRRQGPVGRITLNRPDRRKMPAGEAAQLGLVTRLVTGDALDEVGSAS